MSTLNSLRQLSIIDATYFLSKITLSIFSDGTMVFDRCVWHNRTFQADWPFLTIISENSIVVYTTTDESWNISVYYIFSPNSKPKIKRTALAPYRRYILLCQLEFIFFFLYKNTTNTGNKRACYNICDVTHVSLCIHHTYIHTQRITIGEY